MFSRLQNVRGILAALVATAIAFAPFGVAAQPSTAQPSAAQPSTAPKVISVSVSGNVHVPTDRILGVVKTRAGEPLDEATLRSDLQAIFDLGFFADQVPPLIRQRPGGVSVTFRVVENPVITRIAFTGNEHVPSDTLLALMDTAPGQVLNNDTFHQDVLKINSYYDKIGYAGQVRTHVPNLNITPDGVLQLDIREGLTVKSIQIAGDFLINRQLILNAISLKPGMPYSEEIRDKDGQKIQDLYKKYDLSVGQFEAGIDPGSIDDKAGTATVIYTIDVARVGAVQITGNDVTKDIVIRRQLRMRPGMIITDSGIKRDYERLNNLNFFDKVELNTKPGPDPKRPQDITLDWNVKEQRNGTAQVGAGYSGGINGTGLTGTLSYSQNNINGSGNAASIRFEKGARIGDASATISVPYVGDTPHLERYSFGATIYTQAQSNLYPVYAASGSLTAPPPVIATPSPGQTPSAGGTVPVQLVPNANLVSGITSNYGTKSTGVSVSLGRRLSDYVTASSQLQVARLGTDVTVPDPYFLSGSQPNSFLNPQTNSLLGSTLPGSTLGITASSIANTANGKGFNLRSMVLGLQGDTEDDGNNPREGYKAALSEEVSPKAFGSDFAYTISTLDFARFFPVLHSASLGFHLVGGETTGAVPPNKLFVLSDQQLRGYNSVFYGTEEVLLQSELRIPLVPDKKFGIAFFGDFGDLRIRGAQPIFDSFGNLVEDYNQWIYHGDAGVGLRFDLPQLGFRSIRLDFAKGAVGTHTSFGIGQSF